MSIHGTEVKLFTGSSNPELATAIASKLGMELGKCTVKRFADGEVSVNIEESVRGCDVFVIQSTCAPVNDHLMELLIMADALRRASAARITAVVPYFGYGRQDRKTKPREPISAKLVANLIVTAGYDRVLTMDLHASQIQGFFDIPVDNMLGTSVLLPHFEKTVGAGNPEYAVVSPDFGAVARTRRFAEKLGLPMAIIDKRRQRANESEVMNLIGDVKGKKVIIVDDMVDTAGTLCHGAEALMKIGGAIEVIACASHGVLSGPAIERLEKSCISKLTLLDTIPLSEEKKKCKKIEQVPVAEMFAEGIKRISTDDSVSALDM